MCYNIFFWQNPGGVTLGSVVQIVKTLNSIKLEDRVSVMYNNKIKHSIFS